MRGRAYAHVCVRVSPCQPPSLLSSLGAFVVSPSIHTQVAQSLCVNCQAAVADDSRHSLTPPTATTLPNRPCSPRPCRTRHLRAKHRHDQRERHKFEMLRTPWPQHGQIQKKLNFSGHAHGRLHRQTISPSREMVSLAPNRRLHRTPRNELGVGTS